MAKSILRLKARRLREKGVSIIVIAKRLGVAKSTVSLWCRDIELTKIQIEKLLKAKENGLRLGQIMGAQVQKKKRLEIIDQYKKEGLKEFKNISDREHLITGLVLYLAEGAKKSRRIEFVNSDPAIILFMRDWFIKFFSVPPKRFVYNFTINEIHRKRVNIVTGFWTDYLGVSDSQFRKAVFVKTKQKKSYVNYDNYYGTFRLSILKSTYLLYRILGLIEGVMSAKTGRRSSMGERNPYKVQVTGSIPVAGTRFKT